MNTYNVVYHFTSCLVMQKIFICFSSSSKILTHQMSSGALTAALGRSNRDRDITDLVPSAPECSYAACFCEVSRLANTFHTRN